MTACTPAQPATVLRLAAAWVPSWAAGYLTYLLPFYPDLPRGGDLEATLLWSALLYLTLYWPIGVPAFLLLRRLADGRVGSLEWLVAGAVLGSGLTLVLVLMLAGGGAELGSSALSFGAGAGVVTAAGLPRRPRSGGPVAGAGQARRLWGTSPASIAFALLVIALLLLLTGEGRTPIPEGGLRLERIDRT